MQFRNGLEESLKNRRSVFLFTGNKCSTLLMSILKDMELKTVFIDTGCQFDEVIDYVKTFGDRIEIIRNTDASTINSSSAVECCNNRKALLLKEYLKNVNAECLIVPFMGEEKENGIEDSFLKGIEGIDIIRPLDDLREQDIWSEIRDKKLTYASIYNKGYKHVDCSCCMTRHGRKAHHITEQSGEVDKETEEKLKALGYM